MRIEPQLCDPDFQFSQPASQRGVLPRRARDLVLVRFNRGRCCSHDLGQLRFQIGDALIGGMSGITARDLLALDVLVTLARLPLARKPLFVRFDLADVALICPLREASRRPSQRSIHRRSDSLVDVLTLGRAARSS